MLQRPGDPRQLSARLGQRARLVKQGPGSGSPRRARAGAPTTSARMRGTGWARVGENVRSGVAGLRPAALVEPIRALKAREVPAEVEAALAAVRKTAREIAQRGG